MDAPIHREFAQQAGDLWRRLPARKWVAGGVGLLVVLAGWHAMTNGSGSENQRPAVSAPVRVAAVTRRDLDGKLPKTGWRAEERLTKDEALKSFTAWGAWLAFQERDLGTLEVNKLADFVIMDPDPLMGRPEAMLGAIVMKTVVGGKVVYDAEKP